ncbi:MAG: fibronectin type III domain-containing protein, partial [Thermoleophilia bacterium]
LNAVKSVNLTGLSPSTTYYVKVTSYDGYANGAVSSEISFTTAAPPCTVGQPTLSLAAPVAFWGSYPNYTAGLLSVTWTVKNTGSTNAVGVAITSSTSTYAPITTVAGWAAVGNIAAGGSGSTVIQYQLPAGFAGSGFHVLNKASASDCAGNPYTYGV